MKRKVILLLSNDPIWTLETERLLRVAGYIVKEAKVVGETLQLCASGQPVVQPVGLLIAFAGQAQQDFLASAFRKKKIEKLLLVQSNGSCRDLYCHQGGLGCLCQSSALIACINEMINGAESLGRECSSISGCSSAADFSNSSRRVRHRTGPEFKRTHLAAKPALDDNEFVRF